MHLCASLIACMFPHICVHCLLELQKKIFDYYSALHDEVVKEAKRQVSDTASCTATLLAFHTTDMPLPTTRTSVISPAPQKCPAAHLVYMQMSFKSPTPYLPAHNTTLLHYAIPPYHSTPPQHATHPTSSCYTTPSQHATHRISLPSSPRASGQRLASSGRGVITWSSGES